MDALYSFIQTDDSGPSGLFSVIQDADGNLTFQLQTFRGHPGICTVPAAGVAEFIAAMQAALQTAGAATASALAAAAAKAQQAESYQAQPQQPGA